MNKGKSIQSVDRACAILEAIAAKNEAGVTELSGILKLHVATIHNLVRTLTARNYLVNVGGRYRLGPAVSVLSSKWDPAVALPALLRPYVENIVNQTGESAVAVILKGSQAEMIIYLPGSHDVTVQFPQKTWVYPLTLATGRLLVAFQRRETWDEFIRRHISEGFGSDAEQNWTQEDWKRELTRIAEEKTAVLRRPNLDAVSSLAAPVWSANGKTVLAALGVSCPNCRFTNDYFLLLKKEVAEAARQASRFLPAFVKSHGLKPVHE